MRPLIVLDAAAFDVLGSKRGADLRILLRYQAEHGGRIRCAAVTLAEVCRSRASASRVEAALARAHGGQRIRVIPTDERLAKLVGAILYQSRQGSEKIADAHVVAACAPADAAVVITGDPADIMELAPAVPRCRIVTRHPEHPLSA